MAAEAGSEPKETAADTPPAPTVEWLPGPPDPVDLGPSKRARLVRLTAHWCHWCGVFEREVLPNHDLRAAISHNYEALVVDVDANPKWMDLPGIEGLPVLAFFDAQGRHVLTRSGYREAEDVTVLLGAVAEGLRRGELEPYPDPPAPVTLTSFTPLDSKRASAELDRLEGALYIMVNENDGGFATPARHPRPAVLLELQRWTGRTERAERWISLTIDGALRGHSPRLDGEALADFPHDAAALVELSREGAALPGWREAVDRLPTQDPYRGLQDPGDHGVFRYSAGPGWYHPHFERRAMDNLSWALLLRARGLEQESEQIHEFVVSTFASGALGELSSLNTSQRTDPFYFRLTAQEREGVAPPRVDPLATLEVQARAARLDHERCALLDRVAVDRWPHAHWSASAEDEASPPATVDAVGELLVALASCPGRRAAAAALAELVEDRWNTEGFVVNGRLIRLAAGVCHAKPEFCPQALASVEGLELDLDFPPPLAELAQLANSRRIR